MQQRALQNALERGRRLRRRLHPGGQGLQVLRHERFQGTPELRNITPAVVDHVLAGGVIEQCVQDVFQRDVFVMLPRRRVAGCAERALQFMRQHRVIVRVPLPAIMLTPVRGCTAADNPVPRRVP